MKKMINVISDEAVDIIKNSSNYNKHPFGHIIIDNFLKEEYLNDAVQYTQRLRPQECTNYRMPPNPNTQYKFAYDDINRFPLRVKQIFRELNSERFCEMLEKFVGIDGFIFGNHELEGAGIHKITNGGFLGLHTDFNNYNDSEYGSLDRRVNILIYLNPDWKEEYGGHLWIGDSDSMTIHEKVLPILNRCIIFNTTNKSIHGHPERMTVPSYIHRNSIALYYYTRNKNVNTCFENDKFHSTIYYDIKEFAEKI